ERQIFSKIDLVFNIIGDRPNNIKSIVVSETMQKDSITYGQANGLWEPENQRIIIWRPVLKNEQEFLGVLLHEMAHALSGATDATRAFESELTRLLGIFSKSAISKLNFETSTNVQKGIVKNGSEGFLSSFWNKFINKNSN